MARKRETNIFSLSFLDIMSCGFGAVILIYIIINHATVTTSQELNAQLMAEVKKFEIEVKEETADLIILRNTAEEQEDEIITTEQLAIEVITPSGNSNQSLPICNRLGQAKTKVSKNSNQSSRNLKSRPLIWRAASPPTKQQVPRYAQWWGKATVNISPA